MNIPFLGQMVYYMSHGSPDGKYPSVPRAAVITDVKDPELSIMSLAVINPTGLFFDRTVEYDQEKSPGTWHFPECDVALSGE